MDLDEVIKPAKDLEATLLRMVERGYYEYRAIEPGYWNPIPYQTIRSIARDTARKLKRPFVQVWQGNNGMRIRVPKRKYTAPIINILQLAAKDDNRAPISSYWHGVTYWEFNIRDPEITAGFLEHLRSPEARKAMRLPAEVTP